MTERIGHRDRGNGRWLLLTEPPETIKRLLEIFEVGDGFEFLPVSEDGGWKA